MRKGIPVNRERQQIKGMFIFQTAQDLEEKGLSLMKSLDCTVMSCNDNKILVKTNRANLQSIKTRWMTRNDGDLLGKELQERISRIVIGGNV